jgi:hypothetical protein
VTAPKRLAGVALAASLAACGSKSAPPVGLLLREPSAVATFRGFNFRNPPGPGVSPYPYLAIANAASNELTIVDAVTDAGVPAPVSLRTLVVPVPDRPALLASADLGDGGAYLLVAVTAGDSRLQVVRTWSADLDVDAGREVPLDGDVIALVAVPTGTPGQARIAAALSGRQLAVVTFARAGDGSISLSGPPATATFGFQPVDLAAMPGETARIWAATPDEDGVFPIDVAGPTAGTLVGAGAPTRLVAAARLAERPPTSAGEAGLDPVNWNTTAPVRRVYAVLDESACGTGKPVACGLVALDADAGGLAPDFVNAANPRAPIAIPGRPLALAASGPPSRPPSDAEADRLYGPPFMRISTSQGPRGTTGAAAVASTDGVVYYVDLGRWELPSEQLVHAKVGATVSATRPTGVTVDQWLVLEHESGATLSHLDPAGLATAVRVTPGFTPSEHWTVTFEGVLPGLSSRRAETGDEGGAPWLALQVGVPGVSEVVRLYDPTLGVAAGDTVVLEPTALASCAATFEARVDPADPFVHPDGNRPGGAVRLAPKADPAHPEWDACVDALRTPGPTTALHATFRAGDRDVPGGPNRYVLVRGTGAGAVYAGRPKIDEEFRLEWSSEAGFTCPLPPGAPWNPAASCDPTCRAACEGLLKAQLARRIAYVPETCGTDAVCTATWGTVTDVFGPALRFTLRLEKAAEPPRDLALVIDTREGRSPFRFGDPLGTSVDARSAVPFDRSPWSAAAGVRFLVPFASGVVLDASPSDRSVSALR